MKTIYPLSKDKKIIVSTKIVTEKFEIKGLTEYQFCYIVDSNGNTFYCDSTQQSKSVFNKDSICCNLYFCLKDDFSLLDSISDIVIEIGKKKRNYKFKYKFVLKLDRKDVLNFIPDVGQFPTNLSKDILSCKLKNLVEVTFQKAIKEYLNENKFDDFDVLSDLENENLLDSISNSETIKKYFMNNIHLELQAINISKVIYTELDRLEEENEEIQNKLFEFGEALANNFDKAEDD